MNNMIIAPNYSVILTKPPPLGERWREKELLTLNYALYYRNQFSEISAFVGPTQLSVLFGSRTTFLLE